MCIVLFGVLMCWVALFVSSYVVEASSGNIWIMICKFTPKDVKDFINYSFISSAIWCLCHRMLHGMQQYSWGKKKNQASKSPLVEDWMKKIHGLSD